MTLSWSKQIAILTRLPNVPDSVPRPTVSSLALNHHFHAVQQLLQYNVPHRIQRLQFQTANASLSLGISDPFQYHLQAAHIHWPLLRDDRNMLKHFPMRSETDKVMELALAKKRIVHNHQRRACNILQAQNLMQNANKAQFFT